MDPVTQLEDRIAILDLLNRYTQALNHRDWQALGATFSAQGIWDAGGPLTAPNSFRFEGAKACAEGIAMLVAPMKLCIQSNHAPTIELSGSYASATSTISELLVAPDASTASTNWGTYYDDLERGDDGEWRFAQRRYRFSYIDSGIPGTTPILIPVERPSP